MINRYIKLTKLKKIYYILLFFGLFSCREEKNNSDSVSNQEIESLLVKANDFEISNKQRVVIANQILTLFAESTQ